MSRVFSFFKNWALPISMATGVILYLIYHYTPVLRPIGPACKEFCEKAQPILIACMLFLQFNKVPPSCVKVRKWHLWCLLLQGGIFTVLGLLIIGMPESIWKILIETFMACIMCPVATASGVITDKLGGDLAANMSYLLLCNILYCILFPLIIPLVHPMEGLTFTACFLKLAGHISLPLLGPCLAAWILRFTLPKVQAWLASFTNLAFWLWTISLAICLILTTRIIIMCHMTFLVILAVALVSMFCCIGQFWAGRKIGARYGRIESMTAGQSLGQKNTGFMIWTSYSFLTPQTAVGGGFYAIWHNVVNSWELYQKRKES